VTGIIHIIGAATSSPIAAAAAARAAAGSQRRLIGTNLASAKPCMQQKQKPKKVLTPIAVVE
jgi:hypothetical protein